MLANALDGLRNSNLNAAYKPKWQGGEQLNGMYAGGPAVPQGDTRFNPFLGTGWDRWLDAAGAKRPGGVRMSDVGEAPGHQLPMSPMGGGNIANDPNSSFNTNPYIPGNSPVSMGNQPTGGMPTQPTQPTQRAALRGLKSQQASAQPRRQAQQVTADGSGASY